MRARDARIWAVAALAAAWLVGPAAAQSAAPASDVDLRGADSSVGLPAPGADDALPDLATPAKPAPAKPPRKTGALPALAPYRHAQRLDLKGGPTPDPALTTPAPSVAALPAPPPKRLIPAQDKPFAPVGLFVGDLKLTPYFEQDGGYNSNPFGLSGPAKGSALSTSELGVGLASDWRNGELSGSARLGYNAYAQTPKADAPYGNGQVDYRYDASRDLSFDTEGRYALGTETNAQLGLGGANTQQLTMVSTYGATLGGVDKFGDLSLGLHGSVDRTQYQGGALDSDDENDYSLKLRASYRVSEAFSPYAEVSGDMRVYDDHVDAYGYDRASDGVSGVAGAAFNPSQMLKADINVGYGARAYRDARLPDVLAPLYTASLDWSPTPLTTVTFKATTSLADAVVAGASADLNHAYTLGLSHNLTDRVTLGLTGGFSTDAYVGDGQSDHAYTLGATAEYHLSRDLSIKASATHQDFVSNLPGQSYTADTALLGVRLQR